MNIDRMNKLADFIESLPHSSEQSGGNCFNLQNWFAHTKHCGTIGCIGGWTHQLSKEDPDYSESECNLDDFKQNGLHHDGILPIEAMYAADWLEIYDSEDVYHLFYPNTKPWKQDDWHTIKPKQAAEVIRLVIKGIEVTEAYRLVMNDLPRPVIPDLDFNVDQELTEIGVDINQLPLKINQEV